MSSGDLILSKVAGPRSTAAALMPRNQNCPNCPPIKEGITSACSCFFTPGPQQTVTRDHTVATGTITSTTTTTTFVYSVRTRTLAGTYSRVIVINVSPTRPLIRLFMPLLLPFHTFTYSVTFLYSRIMFPFTVGFPPSALLGFLTISRTS